MANLELHGKGTFFDPRLDNAAQFPIAGKNHFGHTKNEPDLITSNLPALHSYQLAIPAPKPPKGSFDEEAAKRGDELFSGKAQCSRCHTEPIFSEPGWNLHKGSEVCIDDFEANRGSGPSLSHNSAEWNLDPHKTRVLSRRTIRHPA